MASAMNEDDRINIFSGGGRKRALDVHASGLGLVKGCVLRIFTFGDLSVNLCPLTRSPSTMFCGHRTVLAAVVDAVRARSEIVPVDKHNIFRIISQRLPLHIAHTSCSANSFPESLVN